MGCDDRRRRRFVEPHRRDPRDGVEGSYQIEESHPRERDEAEARPEDGIGRAVDGGSERLLRVHLRDRVARNGAVNVGHRTARRLSSANRGAETPRIDRTITRASFGR